MKRYLSMLLCGLLFFACTDTEQFRVNGEVAGNPTMNLRILYYANGAYVSTVTAVREGKFEFFCNSPQHTMVEICDNDYRPLAHLWAKNGETYTVNINREKPYGLKVDGNDVSRRWSEFLNHKADSLSLGSKEANAVVANYIGSHRSDVLSTLLLLTTYDASVRAHDADSLLSLIAPEARPSALTDGFTLLIQRLVREKGATVDSIRYIDAKDRPAVLHIDNKPYNLMAFVNSESRKSEKQMLQGIATHRNSRKIAVFDLLVSPKEYGLADDTLKWTRGSIPGGLASPQVDSLAIPTVPFFIVCDSAGRQLLRTPKPERAKQFVDSILK